MKQFLLSTLLLASFAAQASTLIPLEMLPSVFDKSIPIHSVTKLKFKSNSEKIKTCHIIAKDSASHEPYIPTGYSNRISESGAVVDLAFVEVSGSYGIVKKRIGHWTNDPDSTLRVDVSPSGEIVDKKLSFAKAEKSLLIRRYGVRSTTPTYYGLVTSYDTFYYQCPKFFK